MNIKQFNGLKVQKKLDILKSLGKDTKKEKMANRGSY